MFTCEQIVLTLPCPDASILGVTTVTASVLTGVENSGEHPTLGEADGDAAVGVLQQDIHAARPQRRSGTPRVVVAPVPHQHTAVILRVKLTEGEVKGQGPSEECIGLIPHSEGDLVN